MVNASPDLRLQQLDLWWRAANYLSVGQIYLMENPLFREPLTIEQVKPRLLGHWGTTPGLNLVYAHLNRLILERDLNVINITGPGHGGPGIVANTWLEGTYSELYPDVSMDTGGMRRLFKQFSFPGGIPSHCAPEIPGSIHEGGELGYSLAHAFGAAFDNPELVVACVIGDGEAETGPLAGSWHSSKFLNPVHDGAVLPILHLNGWKIANPTYLARMPETELEQLFRGYGYEPHFVSSDDSDEIKDVHRRLAQTFDAVADRISEIQLETRSSGFKSRPRWPMIVLRTPKGWTGPDEVDGVPVEGTWRSHQVPLSGLRDNPEHLEMLGAWLASYGPEKLFDEGGCPVQAILDFAPRGDRRMSANPHANGGVLLKGLRMPDFRDYALDVPRPGCVKGEATRALGRFLRDVVERNEKAQNFRIFGPDETESNRLTAVYEATSKVTAGEIRDVDRHLGHDGRVMEVLSEHLCQGWLEGYLLTGRHGLFTSYEAFIHIVDSMVNQHLKWLKVTDELAWRRPIASLNYLLSSHVWRQDHNGFSHQDPGFIDHVVNKGAGLVRAYLPPDTNTLLATYDHVLRTRQYVNVVVAGKQPGPDYLTMEEAQDHCARGLGIWEWAGTEEDGVEPDVVLACAGDIPTIEVLAAADLLRRHMPELRVRVVNVVDLMRLQDEKEHPHGLSHRDFDALFTTDRPVIFAFHGYQKAIHEIIHGRPNSSRFHVHGFQEQGTTTTPFNMVVLNEISRFHLASQAIRRGMKSTVRTDHLQERLNHEIEKATTYAFEHFEDPPYLRDWVWRGN